MKLSSVLMKLSARSQDRAVLRGPVEVPPTTLLKAEDEYETSSNEETSPDKK